MRPKIAYAVDIPRRRLSVLAPFPDSLEQLQAAWLANPALDLVPFPFRRFRLFSGAPTSGDCVWQHDVTWTIEFSRPKPRLRVVR